MRSNIPPDLRALARVVSDVDCTQFPELFAPPGVNPPVRELEILLAEITGAPLSAKEFRQFQMIVMEQRHHLRGVDITMVAETQVGNLLSLTSRLDTSCTEAEVPLSHVFPHVKEMHNFFLGITSFKCTVKLAPVFYRLSGALCTLLLRALEELERYMDEQAASIPRKNRVKLRSKKNEEQHFEDNVEEEEDGIPWLREETHLPAELECTFADIDGDISFHLAHLRWYVEVCQQSAYLDSGTYLGDISVGKIWNAYVGKEKPACFAEIFEPALTLFPEWSRVPIMEVLNYRNCGVVSLYTLNRLLSVWGPFLLLDCNMKDDMRVGLFDLGHSSVYHQKAFARRPDAEEGDCIATLTDVPGEVTAFLLMGQRKHQTGHNSSTTGNSSNGGGGGNDSSGTKTNGENSLTTWRVRFTQEAGAWVAEGLIAAEYETVYDACCAFPELFRRPCGKCYDHAGTAEETSPLRADLSSGAANPVSSLHRACFRNNSRYVKTLLDRGSSVVVNTALVDPAISQLFLWTPLLCAVNNPNGDPGAIVRMLLDAGADVDIVDNAQCTALYYAIANGYVDATRVLLERHPRLHTSASSIPLLLAMGAHYFHACESDIRRLCNVIPCADMLRVLLPYNKNIALVRLCVEIIIGKLRGEERVRLPTDDISIWCPSGEEELRTPEEEKFLSEIIDFNNRLCLQFREDVSSAARLLYNHCYFLSCREAFKQDTEENAGEESTCCVHN